MNRRATIALKLAPVLAPFLLLFGGGLLFAVLQSFGLMVPVPPVEGGLATYRRLLGSPWFAASLGFSLYVAFVSAAVSVFLGTLLAWGIWRLPEKLQRYCKSGKGSIVATASLGDLQLIGNAVKIVDAPPPQVRIEAVVYELARVQKPWSRGVEDALSALAGLSDRATKARVTMRVAERAYRDMS